MSCCCRCNKTGRCKNCCCIKQGRACSTCLPLRLGHCANLILNASPPTQASTITVTPSTISMGPPSKGATSIQTPTPATTSVASPSTTISMGPPSPRDYLNSNSKSSYCLCTSFYCCRPSIACGIFFYHEQSYRLIIACGKLQCGNS